MERHGKDRQAGTDTRHHQDGAAIFGHGDQCDNPFQVVIREYIEDKAISSLMLFNCTYSRCLETLILGRSSLYTQANACHGHHGLRWVPASNSFRRQHNRIRSIQYGICYIHHFGTGWQRVCAHRYHHLGCGNDGTIQRTAQRISFFWMPISSGSLISMPRSLRATISTSEDRMISSMASSLQTASGCPTLETILA